MRQSVPSDHRQEADYIYVAIVCVWLIALVVPVAAGIFSLQHRLPPADSLLSGPTRNGELMLLTPIVLIGILSAFTVAWPLAKWVRRRLGMPARAPLSFAAWMFPSYWQSINWRWVAGITGAILILIAAKGFWSYFYVTERGISVRPPLEFSMRHYEWKDVSAVSVQSRDSAIRRQRRFHYDLRMTDGYEVDLTGALGALTMKRRVEYAERFADVVPSHLSTMPNIAYEFNVSEDGLALLGKNRGIALPNAIRLQVLAHGGSVQ